MYMKKRLVTLSMVAVFAFALAFEGLAETLQDPQPQTGTTAAPRRQRRNRNRAAMQAWKIA
jgi:hypothetical protein